MPTKEIPVMHAVIKDLPTLHAKLGDRIEIVGVDSYERGYSDGYVEGLAARQYEVWTITYADGTTEEKRVALV